jgi:iduronate 2-sulfatase
MLKDPMASGRGWALTQVTRGTGDKQYSGYSLRTPRWRYNEWDGGTKGRELYDHENDPHELTNLANVSMHTNRVAELSEQLRTAVKASFPESGERPPVKEGLWAPQLAK